MQAKKTDPRIVRTRTLLMDAFIKLSHKKDFKDITISDITNEATVNRVTFYSHFEDKYELMDAAISEVILTRIGEQLERYDTLNDETVINIFLLLTKFHVEFERELSSQCKRSLKSFCFAFETKIKKELETLFYGLLQNQENRLDSEAMKIGAAVLSASIYGAVSDWKKRSLSAEEYIQYAIPFIFQGSMVCIK